MTIIIYKCYNVILNFNILSVNYFITYNIKEYLNKLLQMIFNWNCLLLRILGQNGVLFKWDYALNVLINKKKTHSKLW